MADNESSAGESGWRKLLSSWRAFFVILFAPPILTALTTTFITRAGDAAPAVATCASAVAGILCGVMLGRRVGKTAYERIGFGILLTAIITVACITMSCFGCLASGYELSFH